MIRRLQARCWRLLEERVGTTVTAQYVWANAYIDQLILRDRNADCRALRAPL